LIFEQAADAVVKTLKGALSRAPWAQNAAVANTVERKIHTLVERVAALARNVNTDNLDPLVEPLIQDFRTDLLDAKLSPADADEVVESVRAQIRITVLQPLRDVALVQKRLEVLEKENVEQSKRLQDLERDRESFAATERRIHAIQTLAAVALTLAVVATLVSVLLFTRR